MRKDEWWERYKGCHDLVEFIIITSELIKEDPMGAKYLICSLLTALGFVGLVLLVIALTIILGPKGLLAGATILITLGGFATFELIKALNDK